MARARLSRRNQTRAIRRNGARDNTQRICAPTFERLEAAAYPMQETAEHGREDDVEIIATLADCVSHKTRSSPAREQIEILL